MLINSAAPYRDERIQRPRPRPTLHPTPTFRNHAAAKVAARTDLPSRAVHDATAAARRRLGLLGDGVVGVGGANRDVGRLRDGHGFVLGGVELGVGRRDHALCAARTGGRPDASHCRVLPGVNPLDGRYGVGMGCGSMGRHEIL